MSFTKIICGLGLLGLLAASSCGTGAPAPVPVAKLEAQLTAPTGVVPADVNAHWTVAITGGTAPYTIAWDFGGGSAAAVAPQSGVTTLQSAVDVKFKPGDWTATVTITDADSSTATATTPYRIILPLGPGGIVVTSALSPDPDTLYAIPLQLSAAVGDEVTIQVVTGTPANLLTEPAFRLLVDSDATYVANSFNIGDAGGAAYDADGFWDGVVANGNFLPFPDSFISPPDQPADPTKKIIDIGILPLGPSGDPDFAGVTGKRGAIFNFKLKYSTPGVKTLNFQLRESTGAVDRTFYFGVPEGQSTANYWANIANDGSGGVPNTITIT